MERAGGLALLMLLLVGRRRDTCDANDAPNAPGFFRASAALRIGSAMILLGPPLLMAPYLDFGMQLLGALPSSWILAVPPTENDPKALAAMIARVPLDLSRIASCRSIFLIARADLPKVPVLPILGRSESKFSLNLRIFSPCLAMLAASRADNALWRSLHCRQVC
eukprot:CAMPEP_0202016584 /NCGR_PEP_ID=MMETSP0905-20130828/34843_1 /ASSEMBLY_ACC=CAM_ASM_000554 /TAXON_ID=420261 /ORGANISM="Thalassiosira antarctica, Strain CCMP982" /LENGTH=164 /DNA_ID=CAMNT_0048577009 /DNA_START=220 /DNA_END=711 /DNA_ORIENTATION=+